MKAREISKDVWAALAEEPLSSPPPGFVPGLVHPVWYGHGVVIASSVCVPIMLIMSCIRIYTKCYRIRKWVLDDYIFLVSLIAALMYIFLTVAITCGSIFGYHAWDIKIGQVTKSVLVRMFVFVVLSGPLNWATRLALFSLIYFAFRPIPYIRRLVYVGVLVTGLYNLAASIIYGVICGPHGGQDRASYLKGFASQRCGNPSGIVQILGIASGAVNLVTDLYLFLLPLPSVLILTLPRKRMTGVLLIFLTATSGCVMSALALFYRYGANAHEGERWNHDVFYKDIPLMIVTIIESAVGIIIPCMASFAKFWSLMRPFFSNRLVGLRRLPSSEISGKVLPEPLAHPEFNKKPAMDSIDRMLMQMHPRASEN